MSDFYAVWTYPFFPVFFFSANTGTMPKTSQITMNSKHTYTSTNTNLSKILKF